MSRTMTGSLSLLAAALLAPAAAQAASPACDGDNAMPVEGQTTIVRSGSGHTATISRTDPDGTIHLEQHGEGHAALAVQSGSGGQLVIDQRGTSTEAEVVQDGACNAAELAQSGEGNRAAVTQSGSGNRAVVRQSGSRE